MHRRRFLSLSAAAGGAALGAGPLALASTTGPAAAALVVTDISPLTDAARLVTVLETFVRNGLWVTCALRPAGDTLDGYGAIVEALAALAPAVELALDLPAFGVLTPHFQGRAAFEARRALDATVGEGPGLTIRTVLCDPAEVPTDPVGVRSAGVRNVLLRPAAPGPTRTEAWANGVVRFSGGSWITPSDTSLPLAGDTNQRLFYLSADSFAETAEAELAAWAHDLADAFLDAELRGEMTAMPVSELQYRDDFSFTRHVAIRLSGDSAGLREFAQTLAKRSITVQIDTAVAPVGYWIPEPGSSAAAKGPVPLAQIVCGDDGRLTVEGVAELPPGIALLPVTGDAATPGMDDCAVLELRERVIDTPVTADTALAPAGGQDDLLLTIEAAALATPADQRALLDRLDAMAGDGISRFTGLQDLVNTILSHDPIERRFRRTLASAMEPETADPALSDPETALYLDDARRAWAFFETFTDPNTGLCPATANVHTGGDALTWVTMWDVGSQVNALVAAHRLGLIETATFETAARRILYQIAGRRSEGRLLPHGVIRTDMVRSGSSDFDGCDAGRLLAALDNLRRHSDLGDEIGALVSSWDLDQIVIDGAIHSVTDGVLKSTFLSHCSHYAVRAFDRWGLAAGSPYETMDGRTEADGRMALMEAAAGIGPLGAEPLLLEALELGMSPESAWLADVLHVAQVEEYDESGTLMAVSEMPIRREPWFVYLGLQLGRAPREWGIDVVGGVEEYRTPEFLDQNMALSTKAAYLWSAYRPGPYADALVGFVRDHARLPIGFASNVAPGEDAVAAPFTDLNTNAVILEAIAHKLVGDASLPTP